MAIPAESRGNQIFQDRDKDWGGPKWVGTYCCVGLWKVARPCCCDCSRGRDSEGTLCDGRVNRARCWKMPCARNPLLRLPRPAIILVHLESQAMIFQPRSKSWRCKTQIRLQQVSCGGVCGGSKGQRFTHRKHHHFRKQFFWISNVSPAWPDTNISTIWFQRLLKFDSFQEIW
jgi:hypothetical protein